MSRLDLPPGALVGRDRELAFLRGFFQEAAVSGGAVLLSGDPGVGKTALLNGLADSASAAGTTVLRVAGAEFEQVARLLEEAAHRIYQRGDYSGAVARLTRAAELSPAAADRGRQLAEAAYIGAEALGEIKSTFRLLEGTRQADPHLSDPLYYASAAAFVVLNADGHIDTAHRLLTGAIEGGGRTGGSPRAGDRVLRSDVSCHHLGL